VLPDLSRDHPSEQRMKSVTAQTAFHNARNDQLRRSQKRGTTMFNMKRLMICAALLTTAGCSAIAGTSGIAETSRTGAIHDVSFEEHMTPANLRVRVGDEVRWINQRNTPVTVEFLGDALDDVTCQRGFSNLMRRQQESATIQPNETASLCFGRPAVVTYNVRMTSPVAGGQRIEAGSIRVSQ
jgi:plastocyanin